MCQLTALSVFIYSFNVLRPIDDDAAAAGSNRISGSYRRRREYFLQVWAGEDHELPGSVW